MIAYTGNWNVYLVHMQTAVTTAVVAMATDKSTTIVAPATATLKMISKPGLNTSSGSEWTSRQED